jgi:hypothetical protein
MPVRLLDALVNVIQERCELDLLFFVGHFVTPVGF